MSVPGTPNNTPDFINHYINQYISEQCVIELNQLSYDYLKQKQETEKEQRETASNRVRYKELTGKESNDPFPARLNKLDFDAKQAALAIAKKEALLIGIDVKEWKNPEPEKTVKEKSIETEKHLNEKQEAMNAKIVASKERQKQQQKQEQKPERVDTKEKQKAQLIQQMREQWGMNKEKFQEPENANSNIKSEELSREEKRAQLIEQMKQQSQELSRNKELNKDIER